MKKILIPAAFVAATVWACSNDKTTNEPARPDFLASNVDSSVSPAQDFFQFANGGWIKRNPIPGSESGWGIGNLVDDEIKQKIRKINEDAAAAKAAEGTETQKIGDFWIAAMDSAKADQLGIAPLQKELDRINGITDVKGLVAVNASFESLQMGMFYYFGVGQDAKNSGLISAQLWQGGLGLPNRDYYFSNDENPKKAREEYPGHISRMLVLAGVESNEAKKAGEDILKFETALAKSSRKLEELRDPEANYNKMTTADVTKNLTPSIDWAWMFTSFGMTKVDSIVVGQPEFFKALENLLKTTDINTLKHYMRFHLVSSFSEYLSAPIFNENFDFYRRKLRGIEQPRPRWKRVLNAEEDAMGFVLGKLFVKEYFNETAKARYTNMVEAIRNAYAARIKTLAWMGDSTKQKALDKLARMSKKVGYPDKWKDYSALKITTNSFCENMMNANRWSFADQLAKYGKPVDRTEWDMTPQTYNAYYNPSNNEIVLPAAIFTIPGVPDSLADDAMVYGYAAASTIGHEITHGFDDEGRQFDAAGNLQSWWTIEDENKFMTRAQVMVDQFNAYEPIKGMFINGKATLGENIADYGGILLGIDAFKQTEQYKKNEKIGGYTPMQRYFMGYALGWLGHQKEKQLSERLLSDVHSPAKWRVNGPFANIPEFYAAFSVKEGDAMWRADSLRVNIW